MVNIVLISRLEEVVHSFNVIRNNFEDKLGLAWKLSRKSNILPPKHLDTSWGLKKEVRGLNRYSNRDMRASSYFRSFTRNLPC